MPSTYAHYRFGLGMLPKFPGDSRRTIQRFRRLYNDSFYIKDCWSEENHKWMLWLVHEETGDRCDLETEDAAAFVKAHGGSV